jgi:hypothetical protein
MVDRRTDLLLSIAELEHLSGVRMRDVPKYSKGSMGEKPRKKKERRERARGAYEYMRYRDRERGGLRETDLPPPVHC